ncbi:MAG: oligosaccharide flippase family protein [Rhodospirillales bacterium]|nr:oligosaccharide flippase family protein [Rhodospirillales bacterium]
MLDPTPMPQDAPAPALEGAIPPAAAPSLAKQVAKGAVWMVAIRFASRTLGLISTLVIARILLPADFGLVAMATAFSNSVDALSEVGLRGALIRHPEDATELYDTAFTMQAARGLITGAVVASVAPFAARWFGDPRVAPMLLVLAALAAAAGFENIAIAEFQRNFRFGMEFMLRILPRLLQVATAITAALLLRSYWALLIAIAVSSLSRLVATYLVHPHRPRFTLRRWRDLVGFSFWTWASSLANLVWQRSDAFIIAPVLGAAAYGLYALAWEVGTLPVTEFVVPVAAALFPGFAEARRRGDTQTLPPMAVVAFLTLLTLPLAIAISAAAAPVVVVLLGSKWLAAAPLVEIIALTCLMAPFTGVSNSLLWADARVVRSFLVAAVSALARVLMLVEAAQSGGLRTFVWWAAASLVLQSVVVAVVLRISGELRLRDGAGSMLRTSLAGAATLAALWASGSAWHRRPPASTLAALVQGGATGVLTIAVFAVVVGVLWRLAGSPPGSEARFVSMVRPLAARLRREGPATAWRRGL